MLKMNMNSELIKKFYKIIEKINNEIQEERYEDGLLSINEAFKEFFRLDARFFNSLSEENLLEMIKTNNIMDIHKCIIMSKLLFEEGRIHEKLYGMKEGFYLYQKSLYMYLEAFLNLEDHGEFTEFAADVKVLIDRLLEYRISPVLQKKVIGYYLMEAAYDKAEDVLYELMEDNDDPGVKEYAISFYKSLLVKEDSDLNKGRLPRVEIIHALNSLE